tara:strand:- start:88 stop:624 length:537 start_codon:yes stop_codon:yes gene_type:complete
MKKSNKQNFEIKAIEGGSISFYASAFGVVDSHKDITHKGTFIHTIEEFNAGNVSVDLRLEHKSTFKTVGSIIEMEIDEVGLICKAIFHDNPIGRKVHKIAKEAFETKSEEILFSIGFVTLEESDIEVKGEKVRSIDSLLLGEVSIVEKPSNKEAKVIEVKNEVKGSNLRAILIQELNN